MSQSRCTLNVQGLDCPNEVAILRDALRGMPGVRDLGFDLINGLMTVDYEAGVTSPDAVLRRVTEKARMQASLVGAAEAPGEPQASWWARNGRWASTAGAGVALGVGTAIDWLGPRLGADSGMAARAAVWCYALAVLCGGVWLYPRAVRALGRLRLDIDVLMGLAILGAIGLGQWDEAATVAFLFGLSESLEAMSLERARRAIRGLLEVAPRAAERIGPDGKVEAIDASLIAKGDRLLVRAGDTIPSDARIVKGRSGVDQKAITGESVPVDRGPGDPVYAGTVNGDGALEVEASGPVSDSLIARIVQQVRAAQAGRAPVERRIGRFAAVYTPAVVAVALLVLLGPPLGSWASTGALPAWPLWHEWFYKALVILVIACPCALVIATPVAVVSGLAAAARGGVLIKGGEFLEEVGRLRALAFDKTGTLTLGRPDVVEVVSASGPDEGGRDEVLRIAAALGDRGGHVLGKAIARHARDLRLDVPAADDYRAIPGKGALGTVGSVEYHLGSHRYIDEAGLCHPGFHDELGEAEKSAGTAVAVTASSGPVGWIRLADSPRPEAADVLAQLHGLGLRTIMLTGDNARTAAAMASQLGVGEQRAELLPADKVSAISDLASTHGPTGMVGDGVNDAPALAAAAVSVSLGGISSGAALETADIILMADDLGRLPWLIRLSRSTLANIRQNIVLALATKAVVLALAVAGRANLWMAIAADVGTTLVVVANSLRLLRTRP
ncbi:putative cadmium-transporting ATPase [Aquisphaera giovannonii]|uniref:P-type Zn(2+) transporter n=1 Tax=Aquisphaera giovannonii TaxID=406548 RepID=A0A5B9WEW6_9BACT|nr:cation-translocating P-type ATPase [Aquisphaera giovannonii]QEH38491.1 putative cadmium-transporting ATPase [Aquisphaera giovannonii]